MRKFRHKTSGITATLNEDGHYHFIRETKDVVCQEHIHKSFIENSNDWEEVKEGIEQEPYVWKLYTPKEEPNYLITAFRCLDLENKSLIRLCHDGKYFDNIVRACGLHTLEDMLYKSPSVQSGAFEIYSVKNSEGEEFVLNEIVKFSNVKLPITKFEISKINGQMDVILRNENRYSLEALEKLKSTIYTTTDGVDIKEGSHLVLYLVNKELNTLLQNVAVINNFSKEDAKVASRYLTFTSEENRDKYIKESSRKPIFVSADGKEYFKTGEKILLHGVWIKSDGVEPFELFDKIKHECDLDVTFSINTTNWLWFSDEKLAQEYIDNNKPKYSLNDFRKIIKEMGFRSDSGIYGRIAEELKNLGK